jgi:hypothetical protein
VNPYHGFLDFIAKMGLTLKGDPPRKIHVEGREWGEPVDGIALSIQEILNTDPEQLPAISVVMKNTGPKLLQLTIPGWMHFYEVETTAELSAFGRQLLKPETRREKVEIALGQGDATETDVPIGSLYDMRPKNEYAVRVSCTLPDGAVVRSNRIVIRPWPGPVRI